MLHVYIPIVWLIPLLKGRRASHHIHEIINSLSWLTNSWYLETFWQIKLPKPSKRRLWMATWTVLCAAPWDWQCWVRDAIPWKKGIITACAELQPGLWPEEQLPALWDHSVIVKYAVRPDKAVTL